jgi:pimeloyl-ACP methyl ester carboxylesterase
MQEQNLAPPPLALLLSEPLRAALEWAAAVGSAPWLASAPRGDGHAVLVLPGLFQTDAYTTTTRTFLRARGFDARPWGGGRNRGEWEALDAVVLPALQRLHQETGRKVSVVGASMGGIYAREAARRAPALVRCVVTLASAVTGPHRANHVWPWFERASGQPAEAMSSPPPPVPSTSVYSRSDGLSAWTPCLQPESPLAENVEVVSSHIGLAWHPAVLYLLADRLAQSPQHWQRYLPPS